MPKRKETQKSPEAPKKLRRKIVLKKAKKPHGLVEVDEVWRKINYIQTERKSDVFKVSLEDGPVVRNILKDAELIVTVTEHDAFVEFRVEPGLKVEEGSQALQDLEELSDEIPEDGQIF